MCTLHDTTVLKLDLFIRVLLHDRIFALKKKAPMLSVFHNISLDCDTECVLSIITNCILCAQHYGYVHTDRYAQTM